MADTLLIGLSALQAHQQAMQVTSHNIANVATPGYSRQRSTLDTPVPENGRPGQIGRGVNVATIARLTDSLLTEQLRLSSTETGRLDQTTTSLNALQSVFNEPSDAGLAASFNKVFSAFHALANNPDSPGLRAGTVEELKTFTAIFNSMAGQIASLRDDIGTQFRLEADQINGLTAQVAQLNKEIRRQVAVGSNPNDLLDQRERLINELSNHLDLKVRIDPVTQAAQIESSGRVLVDATGSVEVFAGSSLDGLALQFADTRETLRVNGGRVGAMLTLYGETLPDVQETLDSMAQAIAYEFNAAHATGTNADREVQRYLGQTVIDAANLTVDLDAAAQAKLDGAIAGIPAAYLPRFTDADGVSQARNLTINMVDEATGVATKYIVRYEPGPGPIPTTRSLRNLIDAINTGTGGGFSVWPSGAGIPNLTASAVAVDGGVRLDLLAAPGHHLDFSRSLDTRPTAETWNAASWTAGAASMDLKGRLTGDDATGPSRPWSMQVLSSGTVGDPSSPPTVAFTWWAANEPVSRTTTVTLGTGFEPGRPVVIGDGVHAIFGSGTLTAGDALTLVVDGQPDQARLLSALGVNTVFAGGDAGSLAVADAIQDDPGRLAVAHTRTAGDNSNLLEIIALREKALFNDNMNIDEYMNTMISDIGSRVDLASRLRDNQQVIEQTLLNRRDHVAGVNLDEEIASLIQSQQAYTAAARIITSVQENIRTLLDLIR